MDNIGHYVHCMDKVSTVIWTEWTPWSTHEILHSPPPPAAGAGLAALEGAHKVDGVAYTLLPLAGDLKIFQSL